MIFLKVVFNPKLTYITSLPRLVLRCRQEARTRFAKMRSDVLVKMELLDQKHGKDFNFLEIILILYNI